MLDDFIRMIEKERKFILINLPNGLAGIKIQQGYLMFEDNKHLRVRIINNRDAYFTFKIIHSESVRTEYEYKISIEDAIEMLKSTEIKLKKIRYKTKFEGNVVDIDVFENGKQVVEIEYENELKSIPNYCGEEVTGKMDYSNIQIARNNRK